MEKKIKLKIFLTRNALILLFLINHFQFQFFLNSLCVRLNVHWLILCQSGIGPSFLKYRLYSARIATTKTNKYEFIYLFKRFK